MNSDKATPFRIQDATEAEIPAILDLIRGLAEYEKLSHEVTRHGGAATGIPIWSDERPAAEVLIWFRRARTGRLRCLLPKLLHLPGEIGSLLLEDLFRPAHVAEAWVRTAAHATRGGHRGGAWLRPNGMEPS